MALTKEDLQAIGALMDSKLEPISNRLDRVEEKLEPISNRLDRVEEKLEPMTARLDAIEETQAAIRTSQLKVELEQYPRIAAALDGVVVGIEKNQAQDERIVSLEKKTGNHDTRIYALEAKIKKAL